MFDQILSNATICLMISQTKYKQKLHKRVSMFQWILGMFGFSENECEMKLAKTRIEKEL